MNASDIMTTDVITVTPSTTVREIATILLKHRISAVPVVDADNSVLGVVSEGDLMRRVETGTELQRSWWLNIFAPAHDIQVDFIKSHGRTAEQVMTRNLITVSSDTSLGEIATLLEKNRIKRVPVIEDGKIIGIVSRANLLHAFAATAAAPPDGAQKPEDREIRELVITALKEVETGGYSMINVVVTPDVVQLWGAVADDTEERAAIVAAESVTGVKKIESYLGRIVPAYWYGI